MQRGDAAGCAAPRARPSRGCPANKREKEYNEDVHMLKLAVRWALAAQLATAHCSAC